MHFENADAAITLEGNINAFVKHGDGGLMSNHVLTGIDSGANIGDPTSRTIGSVTIPEPSVCLLFSLRTGLLIGRQRR